MSGRSATLGVMKSEHEIREQLANVENDLLQEDVQDDHYQAVIGWKLALEWVLKGSGEGPAMG